jgi:membrane peptidoglycan carboxypeptidase
MPDDPKNPHQDDDLPFNLPVEPGYEKNIHKEDTEDVPIVTGDMTAPKPKVSADSDADEIARLHASDQPLTRGLPEDESILYKKESDEDFVNTVPRPPVSHTGDTDVPFNLPQETTEEVDSVKNVGNMFVTIPNKPSAPTLPGTGGLDPNPDFGQTVQSKTVQHPQNTMPNPRVSGQMTQPNQRVSAPIPNPNDARYQRPPQQQMIPPPPPRGAIPQESRLPSRESRRRAPRVGCWAVFIGLFITFCGGFTLLTVVAGGLAYARVGDLLNESLSRLDSYKQFQSTFIYDRNGQPLFEVFDEGRRTTVKIDQFPAYLINATIAIEDDSFYSNVGVDIPATIVSLLGYVGLGGAQTGGSSITQQLVRNVLFDAQYRSERSAQRKAEEILLAIALTGRMSKDQILELYLNEIYYGNLAYGAEAASQIFFGKEAKDLTLGEAALLAGLPQAPANLDPLDPSPDIQQDVQARWVQVLNEMVEEKYITQAEMDDAIRQGLSFVNSSIDLRAPHFTVYATDELESLMLSLGYSPEDVAKGGLQVYTTVDLRLHEEVQALAAQQVANLAGNNVTNAAVLVMNPVTGEILAMVGSVDYNNDAIDGRVNVTIRPRQPGSTIKAVTYASAMERGMGTGDVIWDTRVVMQQPGQAPYEPRNYDRNYHGPMIMRRALANSYNIPAVQTVRSVGVDYFLAFSERFGIQTFGRDASLYGPAITLGGAEMTLLELTRAYTVFANQGSLVNSTSILCVLDSQNAVIYEYENGCPAKGIHNGATIQRTGLGMQVLDPRIAFMITSILGDNGARTPAMGSNSPLYTPNIASSVKTGTTDDFKDNWTVGYTRNVAIGVWVGNNNGDPMQSVSGLAGAAPIWNTVINLIYNSPTYFDEFLVDGQHVSDTVNPPSGLTYTRICDVRSLTDPATGCVSTIPEYVFDYPPMLPDGNGNLVQQNVQSPQLAIPTGGSYVEMVSPGVYRTVVIALPPEIGNAIQFQVGAGQTPPPPPRYCRVPIEAIQTTVGAVEQWFIAPPIDPSDAANAEIYAQQSNLAFLPTIECTAELLGYGGTSGFGRPVTAYISSPQPNEVVSLPMAIMGVVEFSPDQAAYFGIDIIGGEWGNWTPIQDRIFNSVNGQLGILPALASGSYQIRILVARPDFSDLQEYVVPFIVP